MKLKHVGSVCALAFFGAVSTSAVAETLTFQFEGTVVYGSPIAVPPGSKLTGRFSYDTQTAPNITYKGFANYSIPAPARLTAKVAGHTIVSEGMSVSVWDQYGGNVEDMVNVMGTAPVMDGTTFADGAFGFYVASRPGQKHALHNTHLPRSYDMKKFNAEGNTYGILQTDGGQTGTLLQFSIDSITQIKTSQ